MRLYWEGRVYSEEQQSIRCPTSTFGDYCPYHGMLLMHVHAHYTWAYVCASNGRMRATAMQRVGPEEVSSSSDRLGASALAGLYREGS